MVETKCRNLTFRQQFSYQKIPSSVKVRTLGEKNANFNNKNIHSNAVPQIFKKAPPNLKTTLTLCTSFDKLYTFSLWGPSYNFGVIVLFFHREEMLGIASWLGIIHLRPCSFFSLICFPSTYQQHSPGSSVMHLINKKGLKGKALVS